MCDEGLEFDARPLLLAILERAILDMCGNKGFGREAKAPIVRDARFWVTRWHPDDTHAEWTFPWVCLNLDLDPVKIRETIVNLAKDGLDTKRSALNQETLIRRYFTPYSDTYEVKLRASGGGGSYRED